MDKSGIGFITVIDNNGQVSGVITDGDFRRWIITQEKVDLTIKVCEVSRSDCTYAIEGESPENIRKKF